MTTKLYTARGVIDWDFNDGRYYDLVTGRGTSQPRIAKSPTAFACMTIRGQELAQVPWHIKKNDKILDSHALIDMLEDFGEESNYHRGMLYTEIDMLTYGAGLWLRDVDQLRRLDPATIRVEYQGAKQGQSPKDPTKGIRGFTQTINDKETYFKREEIVYFREYHPENDLDFGLPVMEVCKRSVNAEIEALLMIEYFFKNDAVPGLIMTSDQDVTEKEARRFLDWWNKRFRGARNKGKVGVTGKGMKPVVVGSNMKESGVIEILDVIHKDICKAFRVDPMLVAGMSNATYENLNETRKFLIEDVIMPRAVEFQNVINQDLVPQVDPGVVFEFAWDEMQILQEDSTSKQARLTEAYNMGLISDDYFREEMGYPADSKPKEEPDKQAIAEDKWEKKAVKAFQKGESPVVPFETENITIDRQYVIRGRLQNADSVEAVRACFSR